MPIVLCELSIKTFKIFLILRLDFPTKSPTISSILLLFLVDHRLEGVGVRLAFACKGLLGLPTLQGREGQGCPLGVCTSVPCNQTIQYLGTHPTTNYNATECTAKLFICLNAAVPTKLHQTRATQLLEYSFRDTQQATYQHWTIASTAKAQLKPTSSIRDT